MRSDILARRDDLRQPAIAVLAALSVAGHANSNDFLKNEQVRVHLRQAGDDGCTPRPIDHFAYFSTETGRTSYRAFLVSHGYHIDGESMDVSYPGNRPWVIVFSKVQAPQQIDDETALLHAMAKDMQGIYDGWGTKVIRKK